MTESNYRKKSLNETMSISSNSSSPEEEGRLKALFMSCDSNNDGRLDRADLITMCKKLNMQDLAEAIICALGAHAKGSSISFAEFLKCRAQVLQKVDMNHTDAEYLQYYSQAHYDQVRGSCSDMSQIYSSVDYDSGTQEAHEEPLSIFAMLHQYYPELYNQWTASQSDNANTLFHQLFQLANSIHLARVNRLYAELKIALKRINNEKTSRDMCQKEISRTQKERDKLKLELQNQSARYEDRLTELHSVIAELQKKAERKERNTIPEEEEEPDNVNVEDYEKLDIQRLSSWNDMRRQSNNPSLLDHHTRSLDRSQTTDHAPSLPNVHIESQTEVSVCSDTRIVNIQKNDAVSDRMQEATEKQLKSFHHNNIYLQEKLSGYETVVSNLRTQLASVVDEREILRKQLKDLQECVELSAMPNVASYPQYCSSSCSVSKVSLDSKSTNSSTSSPARPIMGVRQQSKQIQMKAQTPDPDWVIKAVTRYQRSIQSSMNNGINSNSNVVHSMIANCLNEDTNFIQTSGLLFLQELADNVPYPSMAEPCRRIYLEWQRMVAVSDRESSDKLLLQNTLAESKSIADQLQCALVQLQSDCAALTKSNIVADQIIELADIMIQLQDTDPLPGGFLSTSITQSSGAVEPAYQNTSMVMGSDCHSNSGNSADISQLRHGYREQLEAAARMILYRLECYSSMGRQTPDSGAGVSSTLSSGGGSVDVEGVLRQASGTGDWSKTDEIKMRRLLEQLMSERSRARMSVVGTHLAQSFYGQCISSSNQSSLKRQQDDSVVSFNGESGLSCNHQQIIESAILIQEVCSLKEERATLKTSIYLLEKEIKSLQLGLESRISSEKSLKVQLAQMVQHRSDNSSLSSSDESRRMKNQVNDLLQVIEELRERCQQQQQENEEFVNDLKRANGALIAAFEKAKKKYQARISRLEQQLTSFARPVTDQDPDETAL